MSGFSQVNFVSNNEKRKINRISGLSFEEESLVPIFNVMESFFFSDIVNQNTGFSSSIVGLTQSLVLFLASSVPDL